MILVDLDDPDRFPVFELVTLALEIIAELAHVVTSNAPYPSLAAGWRREGPMHEEAAEPGLAGAAPRETG